jgi:glutamate synthase (NADPH/NADH) small chain
MGDPKGFLKVRREPSLYRPVRERVRDHGPVSLLRSEESSIDQASRCMDCGTPFCHWACPVGNYIPEWNDLLFRGERKKALELLNATNNLPEITGRLCPATCEYACVLGINDEPVTIRENELSIIENGFDSNLIKPQPPKKRTSKHIAVIGSGPAGLACADQLNKAGHNVTVFEKDNGIGGILRYGIPDFKLEKHILDRRIKIFEKEGIEFLISTDAGRDYRTSRLLKKFDAICLAGGSRKPRDLTVEGRDLKGIYFAMDYLTQANRLVAGEKIPDIEMINAKDKKVLVIGGGDTGANCVGTAHRQGAGSVVQIEVLPKPPECRTCEYPWPKYPAVLKTSTSHEEGGKRIWSVLTKKFMGEDGWIKKVLCPSDGNDFEIEADLVILAMGFVHPEHDLLLNELGVEFDPKGNVKTGADYMTSRKDVFSAGDMRRGQSLIVWAISEGRRAAYHIDTRLSGRSNLPNF